MDSTLIAQLLGQMDKPTQESPYSMKGLAYKALNQMDDFNKESPDYGMDSYIKKNGVPAPYQSMVEYMKGGRHIGDEFKMPNHQTFSTQSSYSAPDMQGGEWKTGGAEGSPYWSFKPSEFNLKQNPIEELMKYWKSNQPEGTFLQLPDGERKGKYGVETRSLEPSEDQFFKNNPHVGGMAADDNKVIVNPYSTLNDQERQAIVMNESARVHMRTGNVASPTFELTPEQQAAFKSYSPNIKDIKHTIAARVLTNDPSALTVTKEQREYANQLGKYMMNIGRGSYYDGRR